MIRPSHLHFIHCLVPTPLLESRGGQGLPTPSQSSGDKPGVGGPVTLDIPALRVQLAGSHILEALRLHRAGERLIARGECLISTPRMHQGQYRDINFPVTLQMCPVCCMRGRR